MHVPGASWPASKLLIDSSLCHNVYLISFWFFDIKIWNYRFTCQWFRWVFANSMCVCVLHSCLVYQIMVIETTNCWNHVLIGLYWIPHGLSYYISLDSHDSPSSSKSWYHLISFILMDSSNLSFLYRFPSFPHFWHDIVHLSRSASVRSDCPSREQRLENCGQFSPFIDGDVHTWRSPK